jgi:hypothetical protein
MESQKERRAAVRYQLQAPVIFQFRGPDQTLLQGAGFVKDISMAGVFIWTRVVPPIHHELEIEILMPKLDNINFALRSAGKVIRFEPDVGFAVEAEFTFNRLP